MRIGELLQTQYGLICKDQAVYTTPITHCWMLGYYTECALPTIMICCNDPIILRRSMRVVTRQGILKEKEFDIQGIAPYDLRLYAGELSAVDLDDN